MKDRKINVDRPQLSASDISRGKSFDAIVRNHQLMSKPFFKQTWFYGVTGLASLGIIIGGTLAFQNSPDTPVVSEQILNTDGPPVENNTQLAVVDWTPKDTKAVFTTKTIEINPLNIEPIDQKNTLTNNEPKTIEEEEIIIHEESQLMATTAIVENSIEMPESEFEEEVSEKSGNARLDMSPRISDKLGGGITRNQLLDDKGIITEGDISIIHFELHLIDGLGGKVISEEGNQLNHEMKNALENVGQGETIYFENIRGKVKSGEEVHLNPLRYVLMN